MNLRHLNAGVDRSDGIAGANFYADRLPNGKDFAAYVSFNLMVRGSQEAYNVFLDRLRAGAADAGLEIKTRVDGMSVTIFSRALLAPDEFDFPIGGFGNSVREVMAK